MAAARKLPKANIVTPGVLEKNSFWRLTVRAGWLMIKQRPLLDFVFVVYGLGEANSDEEWVSGFRNLLHSFQTLCNIQLCFPISAQCMDQVGPCCSQVIVNTPRTGKTASASFCRR
jgi:hypothetical protein